MLLSDDHIAVQDAVRAFVQDRIAPQAAAWDKSHHFPKAELKGLAELGCYGVAVPPEHGGAGLDWVKAVDLVLHQDLIIALDIDDPAARSDYHAWVEGHVLEPMRTLAPERYLAPVNGLRGFLLVHRHRQKIQR